MKMASLTFSLFLRGFLQNSGDCSFCEAFLRPGTDGGGLAQEVLYGQEVLTLSLFQFTSKVLDGIEDREVKFFYNEFVNLSLSLYTGTQSFWNRHGIPKSVATMLEV